MRSVCFRSAMVTALLLLVLGAAVAAAQSLSSVQGFVSDDTGAGLPGVAVELTDVERGQRRTVITNRVGFFGFRALSSGEYRLDAASSGFRSVRREGLRLQVGQSLDVDLRLGLASIEETVLVTADAPLLEVGRGGAAGYVTEEEIEALPLSGRDFVRFALLQPTVQVDARGSVSLSGQRGVNTGFTIDGANAKSAFFGFGRGGLAREGGGNLVAQESVREFQVVTSGYAAEAGRSGGGAVNVVTKSGTNEFSGSSFLFVRNHGMVSRLPRSPLDAARGVAVDDERYAVDEFRRYNWGASLGGPIRRDRTHFFLSYDQTAQDCCRARGTDRNWTRVDRKMSWSPAASSSQQRARVLTDVKARRFAPPPLRGADGLDAGSAHARPDWLLPTMLTHTPPTCCGRRPVQNDALSGDR